MPFIGRDWRSPGEAWVKTESLGWQRMKIIESQLHPPTCHQNSACSWPPKSEFGQHMGKNCNKQESRQFDYRNSNRFNGSISSGASSSDGSASSSPTGSPEKGRELNHMHPIIISSPYGQYSCCAHHYEQGSYGRPASYCESYDNNNQQTIPRSLSRESVQTNNTNKAKLSNDTKTISRSNNSVSDFRNFTVDQVSFASSTNESVASQDNDYRVMAQRNSYNTTIESSLGFTASLTKLNVAELAKCEQSEQIANESRRLSQSNSVNRSNCCCQLNTNDFSYHQTSNNVLHPIEKQNRTAPHCRISVRTREVAMYNTISEAFYRLDFCNAIHDIRRFNYICKLLHLLITQNLTSLSGCATRVLFTMLEQVAWEVSSNKRNIHVLKNLLEELRLMIQKYYCWGRPIGSSLLWQQHFDTIERISQIVNDIELAPPKRDYPGVTFNDLPAEMVREILLRLSDYRDLVNSAQASPLMGAMISSQYIWKKLCRYHFTEQQMKIAFSGYNSAILKRHSKHAIKYAKTSSADGRRIYRNLVLHKSSGESSNIKKEKELESNESQPESNSTSGCISNTCSSLVSETIKIFDQGKQKHRNSNSNSRNDLKEVRQNSPPSMKSSEISSSRQANIKTSSTSSLTKATTQEIDWERVFHLLRKKFDLKEEYADCLLLCRHCRCLFWKSIGHPCVEDSNSYEETRHHHHHRHHQLSVNAKRNCNQTTASSSSSSPSCENDNTNECSAQSISTSPNNQPDQSQSSRSSVAILSRNFDNRSTGSQASSRQSRARLDRAVNPLQDLNAQINNARNSSRINNNNSAQKSFRKDNELVPKHVTISPQAFLKFFSL